MAPTTIARIAAHKDDPCGLHRNISTRPDCDSDIRRGECGGVTHAVSYHRDAPPFCLKPLNSGSFVGGKHLGSDLIDPKAPCDGLRDGPGITRDHCDAHSQLMQFFHCFFRLRPNFVFHRKCAKYAIL